jgi:hypothetical protein
MRLLGRIMLLGAAVARCATLTGDEMVPLRLNTKECEVSYCKTPCCIHLSRRTLMDSLTGGFGFLVASYDEVFWKSPFSVGSPWPARWAKGPYGPEIASDPCFILKFEDAIDIYIEWLDTKKGITLIPAPNSTSSPQLSPSCLAPGGTIPLI